MGGMNSSYPFDDLISEPDMDERITEEQMIFSNEQSLIDNITKRMKIVEKPLSDDSDEDLQNRGLVRTRNSQDLN